VFRLLLRHLGRMFRRLRPQQGDQDVRRESVELDQVHRSG
jgi:hypothetical protein